MAATPRCGDVGAQTLRHFYHIAPSFTPPPLRQPTLARTDLCASLRQVYGRQPHLLVWEYSINDHAVSLEAASRAGAGRTFGAETMRYLLDYWLRRALTLGSPPPALLLAYLWDKQPAQAFKAGNRAYCRRMPVPGSAFAAQRPVLDQFASAGAGLFWRSAGQDGYPWRL